jgi:hypothetical protein
LILSASGAVLIEGPKWCGKTWTATAASNSQLFMQDPDKQVSYLKAVDTKPSLLLQGETPRLLDEWQTAFLMILTGTEVAYRRDDGVFIVPVGCLKN